MYIYPATIIAYRLQILKEIFASLMITVYDIYRHLYILILGLFALGYIVEMREND